MLIDDLFRARSTEMGIAWGRNTGNRIIIGMGFKLCERCEPVPNLLILPNSLDMLRVCLQYIDPPDLLASGQGR